MCKAKSDWEGLKTVKMSWLWQFIGIRRCHFVARSFKYCSLSYQPLQVSYIRQMVLWHVASKMVSRNAWISMACNISIHLLLLEHRLGHARKITAAIAGIMWLNRSVRTYNQRYTLGLTVLCITNISLYRLNEMAL